MRCISMKNTIEETIDRVTGINIEREGRGMASATATTNTQNLEGSRNITKDLYFFLNEFMEKVLMKLAEKVKSNDVYLKNKATALKYGDNMISFASITSSIPFFEYGTKLTDGRQVQEIKDRVRHLFGAEVNSGQLRTRDVIEFEASKTMSQGYAVLDRGWETIQKVAREQMDSKEKIAGSQQQAGVEIAREDREDRQTQETTENERDRSVDIQKAHIKSGDAGEKNKTAVEIAKLKASEKKASESQPNKKSKK